MAERNNYREISFFKPRGELMRGETRVIRLVLAGWLVSVVGYQVFVYAVEESGRGDLFHNWSLFNLPIHLWLTGQLLPLWFIILCVLFNFWMDRHASRKLEDGMMRFRIRNYKEEE